MNFIQRRKADRKVTCARCQAVGRAFMELDECLVIVAKKEKDNIRGVDRDPEDLRWWKEALATQEAEVAGETRPETWKIKRGEDCVFIDVSGAHYLHLVCATKYIENVNRVL